MKMKESKDPWTEGQKQITFPIPGWISKLTFIISIPFRLVFGVIGIFLSIFGVFSGDNGNYKSIGSGLRDLNKDYEFNWDGTNNMDGDPMSTDEHKK